MSISSSSPPCAAFSRASLLACMRISRSSSSSAKPRVCVRRGRSATSNFAPCLLHCAKAAASAKADSTTPAATATFNDAVLPTPYCGMYTSLSHRLISRSERPCPSFPMKKARDLTFGCSPHHACLAGLGSSVWGGQLFQGSQRVPRVLSYRDSPPKSPTPPPASPSGVGGPTWEANPNPNLTLTLSLSLTSQAWVGSRGKHGTAARCEGTSSCALAPNPTLTLP